MYCKTLDFTIITTATTTLTRKT